ncbi:hypothetical protein [Herbaspirillum huttiense]|jgi:hypothetical protein|uniref:Uncharacterized protein n=2 Tax=Herbaspirillum huttiense TaxID=863372 RepID=A0AAJ2HAX8_9BURK|nr:MULTISPECIES: hypothetical protein [Herbaspirillum]MDR9837126.1 hypothetical protein [Herbaspirillum huttiense]UWE14259.1 hypothetical protein NY669_14120 [Herbaspirillum huttiense]
MYFIGLTQQAATGGLARLNQGNGAVLPASHVYPGRHSFREFIAPIERRLQADPGVDRFSVQSVLGRYGISQELSVGLEVWAQAHFNTPAFVEVVFRQAEAAQQLDAFVARTLEPDEWTDNARPGLTVLFEHPVRIGQLAPLRKAVLEFPGDGWPIDGFTTIPAPGHGVAMVRGLRYVFLPEISVRWDGALRERLSTSLIEIEIILIDQATKIGRLSRRLTQLPNVERAYLNWFDVIVGGQENYGTLIERLHAQGSLASPALPSMARTPFSEMIGLTSSAVLQERLAIVSDTAAPDMS